MRVQCILVTSATAGTPTSQREISLFRPASEARLENDLLYLLLEKRQFPSPSFLTQQRGHFVLARPLFQGTADYRSFLEIYPRLKSGKGIDRVLIILTKRRNV